MLKRAIKVLIIVLFLFSSIPVTTSRADIKLKVAVVNPSPTETQTTPVRYNLPKGMAPEDILDIGSMDLKYDFDKGNYYLYQVMKLKPSEKVIKEVKLRDIWMIPQKDINFLEYHTNAMVEKLKGTKHAEVGKTLAKKIIERLEAIEKKESDQNMTMSDHINLYYENVGVLTEIKEDIGILENLVLDVGGIVEERVQVPATLAAPIKSYEKSEENAVALTVKVTNPSHDAKQTTNVKYLLPEEVTPRYVIDRGSLEMGYDFAKQSFYVYKDNVALNPSESKSYIVKIADIWRIADIELDTLAAHTANLMLLLKGTEYNDEARPIADKITQGLGDIKNSQNLKVSPDEHIAYYRKNTVSLDEIKKAVAQLEKLASQSGASVGVTVKYAEVEKGGGLKEKRARGYEGIDYLVKSIFKGRAPSIATTWKIIYIILGFMGLLAAVFFGLWFVQIKRQKRE